MTETRDLKPNGRNIPVNEDNKKEYVKLVCQMRMTGAIRKQLGAFMEGFYDIIPKRLISIFTEQELELLISGLPTIDIDDLKAHSEYHKYQPTSLQVSVKYIVVIHFILFLVVKIIHSYKIIVLFVLTMNIIDRLLFSDSITICTEHEYFLITRFLYILV